jgi:hypothetical protein
VFKLSEQELEYAFEAINHHGYSAMLPEPIEWVDIQNKWQEVKDKRLYQGGRFRHL